MLKLNVLTRHWVLVLATAVALVHFEQSGLVVGWSSPILARLQAPDSPIPTTSAQGSWIATIVTLVSFACTPLAALCLHFLGRKRSILLAVVPFFVSWVMLAFARNVTELIIARGIAGVGTCLTFTIVPVYLGEIAPVSIRGGIGICMTALNNIGILWIYYIGTFPQFWISSLTSALPLLFVLVFYKWMPESPYFLYEKDRKEEAVSEMKRLRNSEDVEEDMKVVHATVSEKTERNSFVEIFTESQHRRALLICLGVQTFAQFTGGITFLLYAHLIFQKAGNVSANLMSMIKATLQLITSIVSAYIVDNIGKRPLLIVSCVGSAVFMACEGVYFYMLDYKYDVDYLWWLPLVAMILFNISQSIGLQPLSTVYLGELFHPNVKAIAVCISKAYLSISVFTVGQFFQIITDTFGNFVPFFVFSGIGAIGVLFVAFFIPETKGKSFEEIQYYMKHKKYQTEKI